MSQCKPIKINQSLTPYWLAIWKVEWTNEWTSKWTKEQMDKWTDWLTAEWMTNMTLILNLCFLRQFYNNLPKINISTDHADTTVPTKNSHGKIKCCDDAYQTNWIPLLKESVTWTWCETNVRRIRMKFKITCATLRSLNAELLLWTAVLHLLRRFCHFLPLYCSFTLCVLSQTQHDFNNFNCKKTKWT